MVRMRDKEAQLQRLKDIAISKKGELLSTVFDTAKSKYKFKCSKGHEFELTSDKIVTRGDWCPYCAGRYGEFNKRYKDLIENIHNGKMLSDYISIHQPIKCECSNGHVFYPTPGNLSAGKWCGLCNISHGERAIEIYLQNNNIEYIKQYTFPDLKGNVQVLPFDFAVFKNGTLVCLIEYDGEQHFRPMRYSKDKDKNIKKFEQTQFNDKLKDQYCNINNIPLIRISCFDVDYRRLNNLQEDINNILGLELILYLYS